MDSLRFRHGYSSVQEFLSARFGGDGVWCYNFVIGVRLVSEVFANLLVIGVLFGAAGSAGYVAAIVIFALFTLGYSVVGGLRASLDTDSAQMGLFAITLSLLAAVMFSHEQFMAQPFCLSRLILSRRGRR